MRNVIALIVALCLVSAEALADVDWRWSDGTSIDLEYSIGTGLNASLMIVDFQNGDYYVFEYKWDQNVDPNYPVNAWDMIQDLGIDANANQPNPDGNLEYLFFDWGWGISLDGFAYETNTETATSVPPYPSWVYYLSENDISYFLDTSGVGVTDRELFNGSWDGWSWHGDGWGTGNPPVPEPVTLSIVCLGSVALLRRRKR